MALLTRLSDGKVFRITAKDNETWWKISVANGFDYGAAWRELELALFGERIGEVSQIDTRDGWADAPREPD